VRGAKNYLIVQLNKMKKSTAQQIFNVKGYYAALTYLLFEEQYDFTTAVHQVNSMRLEIVNKIKKEEYGKEIISTP
jgi:hypothetical protein